MKSSLKKNKKGKWIWKCEVEVDMDYYEPEILEMMEDSGNYEEPDINEVVDALDCAFQRAFYEGEENMNEHLVEEICNW